MLDLTKPTALYPDERTQQQAMFEALDASLSALRRDECSCRVINGKRGNIQTWGDGCTWSLYVTCRSALHWTWTKKALAFATVTQDGDDEGVLHLQALPTPEQAVEIRERLGILKRRHLSPEELERLRAVAVRFQPRASDAPGTDAARHHEATAGAEIGAEPVETAE